MKIGYARVSSKEQNLDRQIKSLTEIGCEKIYCDKQSGKDFERPEYQKMLSELTSDDVVYIHSIDRLGRNYDMIIDEWRKITNKANIVVLDMPLLDTRCKDGKNIDKTFVSDLVLQILSYVAEKERINIRNRQRAGIDCMTIDKETGKRIGKKGNPTGRPSAEYPANWKEVYESWMNKEITATKSMELLGLKRNTFYNLVKRYQVQ